MQTEDSLHLGDVLGVVRRRLPAILTILALGIAATILFLVLVPKKYTAEAMLKFDPRQFQLKSEQTDTQPITIVRLIAGEIAVVRSPPVIGHVVETLDLADDREILDGMLSGLLPAFLDDTTLSGDKDVKQRLATNSLTAKLNIFNPDRTNIIQIGFTSKDPQKAAKIVNAVLDSYLRQLPQRRLDVNAHTAGWLKERSDGLRSNWQTAARNVEQFKADSKLNFVGGKRLQENRIAKLNDEAVLAGTKAEAARARHDEARRLFDAGSFDVLTTVTKSPVMTGLRARLAAAAQREASLGAALLSGHPSLQRARAGVSVMRREVLGEAKRILDNLDSDAKAASDAERSIRANLERSILQIRATRQALVTLRDLEQTAASEQVIYKAFLKRSKEASEEATGQLANYTVVARAAPPSKPSFPPKLKVLILSSLGFLAAGLGYAFAKEILYDKFRNRRQVEDHLQMPLLATLPVVNNGLFGSWDLKRRTDRIVLKQPASAFSQAVAGLQIDLKLAGRHEPHKLIAITSAEDGEGKTLIASSLAQQAAINGERVLLVDCNFVNRACSHAFNADGEANEPAGTIKGVDIIHDKETGLDILPLSPDIDNSVEFVASETFAALLASARKVYDWVFIDTTSLLATPATWVLVGDVDATVLVVSWDGTERDVARRAVQKLAVCRANPVGVVLNRTNIKELTRYNEYDNGGMLEMPSAAASKGLNLVASSAASAMPAAARTAPGMTKRG